MTSMFDMLSIPLFDMLLTYLYIRFNIRYAMDIYSNYAIKI